MAEFRTRISNVTMKDSASNRALIATDSMANLLTGLGGNADPMRAAFYTGAFINQAQIDNAFRTSPYARKCHVIPATDATRAWRKWSAEDADITKIEAEEKRLGLQSKVRKAEIVARMYGGALMLLGTRDGDLSQELNPDTIKAGGLTYIHIFSCYQVSIPDLILDPGSIYYGQPSAYILQGGDGKQIAAHPSRCVRFINGDMPDDILNTQSGWGDALLTSLWSTLVNSDTAQNTFAALIPKSVVDTVYIPGLTSMASTTEGEDQLKRRFIVAKAFESTLSVKLMDAAASSDGVGEKWETRQIAWTGIPELMRSFMQMLAGASEIPLTRLLGSSADGMNATGEGDQRVYWDHIASLQDLSIRPRLDMIDPILVRSALGEYPDGTAWSWNPLQVDSDEVRAKNAKARAEATKIYSDANIVPPEVLQEAVKNQLIESGEYPGIEQAYDDYAAGNLDSLIEEPEEAPADPLIPVDPTTGMPTQNRESRLFAANDIAARLLRDGATTLEAITEAHRLTDATPRPLYVSRAVLNRDEIQTWATKQGIGELQPDLHVTVLYSREAVDWLKMGSDWRDYDQNGTGKMLVNPGGPRIVEPLGDRTAVLMFAESGLSWRHEEMVRLGASHDYPDYVPHISLTANPVNLTKVKPYTGKIELGPEIFAALEE